MFKQLSTILEKSLQLHQQLLATAEKKREVVISGQVGALQDLLKEETNLIKQLGEVERERLKCVEQIASSAEDGKQIRLSQLLEQMNERDRTVIQRQMKQLLQLVEQVKRENEQNQTLVHQSLQHVQHTLNVLTNHPTDDYVYNPKQQSAAGNQGTSGMFDHKA